MPPGFSQLRESKTDMLGSVIGHPALNFKTYKIIGFDESRSNTDMALEMKWGTDFKNNVRSGIMVGFSMGQCTLILRNITIRDANFLRGGGRVVYFS